MAKRSKPSDPVVSTRKMLESKLVTIALLTVNKEYSCLFVWHPTIRRA